ncbi:hypothetical protein BGZ95_005740, partial [Linnemannia exigua]
MDNNPLTLLCVVNGKALSSLLPVEIESTKTISVLKDLIKTKNPGTFLGVDTKNYALWLAIPISNEDNSQLLVLLDKVFKKDKNKIGRVTRPFKVVPPKGLLDEKVHIIVQRSSS